MFGAVDASLILEVAELEKKEKKVKSKNRKMIAWDKVKTTYVPYKLGRRADSYNKGWAAIQTGSVFDGLDAQAAVVFYEDRSDTPITQYQKADGFIPENNKCVSLQASRYNSGNSWMRTSLIVDHHIAEDSTFPTWLPEEYRSGLELSKGDILLRTMNSFYYLKAQENKRK